MQIPALVVIAKNLILLAIQDAVWLEKGMPIG